MSGSSGKLMGLGEEKLQYVPSHQTDVSRWLRYAKGEQVADSSDPTERNMRKVYLLNLETATGKEILGAYGHGVTVPTDGWFDPRYFSPDRSGYYLCRIQKPTNIGEGPAGIQLRCHWYSKEKRQWESVLEFDAWRPMP